MGKKITILTLDCYSDFANSKSLLKYLASIWALQGFDVEVVQGIKQKIAADIVISHIDLTVVPDEYTEYLQNYPVVINGNIKNISKSLISQNLLSKKDDYSGPVVVKTVANYGGIPELIRAKVTGFVQEPAAHERTWRNVEYLDSYNYPRFDSIQDVPHGVWENSKLIVEKFLPEMDADGNYCLRKCFFLGDKEIGTYETSANPIIKLAGSNRRITEGVPEELRIARERLGVDFSRIDYAMVDGKPVIYDINTTPSIGEKGLALLGDKLEDLAAGINYYLNP